MYGKSLLALIGVSLAWMAQHEPRLDGRTLVALQESYDRMETELRLSADRSKTLEEAINVLIGEAAGELIAARALRVEEPSLTERRDDHRREARALAPIHRLSYDEVLAAAAEKTQSELGGVLAALSREMATAADDRLELQRIEVLHTGYRPSLDTGRRLLDLEILNGTDRALSELLLDCRLDEPGAPSRERGTCRVRFEDGLAPGEATVAQSSVKWRTEPRSTATIEAWPIRAHAADGSILWDVPSAFDPRVRGRIAELEGRLARLDDSLRSFAARSIATHPPAVDSPAGR